MLLENRRRGEGESVATHKSQTRSPLPAPELVGRLGRLGRLGRGGGAKWPHCTAVVARALEAERMREHTHDLVRRPPPVSLRPGSFGDDFGTPLPSVFCHTCTGIRGGAWRYSEVRIIFPYSPRRIFLRIEAMRTKIARIFVWSVTFLTALHYCTHYTRTHAAPTTKRLLCFHVGVADKGGRQPGMKRPKAKQPRAPVRNCRHTDIILSNTFFVDTKRPA